MPLNCFVFQILTAPDLQTHEFVSLAFSPDSKYLIAQGGKPDWILVYWAWEKAKIMAQMKTTNQTGQPVYQVSSSYYQHNQINQYFTEYWVMTKQIEEVFFCFLIQISFDYKIS